MCDFVLFCLVDVVYMCFLPAIYRQGVWYGACSCFILFFIFIFRQLTLRDAPRCVCLPLFLFDLIAVPVSLLLDFYFAVWRTLGCLALLVWLPFVPYAYYMWLFLVYFAFFSWFSLLNLFLAMMSFAGYFHTRSLLSASFPVCLPCFVFFSDRLRSRFVLV